MTEEILLEKKLTTDFTMGFELEAVWYANDHDEDSYVEYEDYQDSIEEFFDSCGLSGGDLHGDGSVNGYGDGAPFEWASPVLPVNMTSINKIINMYKRGLNEVFTVNDSCGLHHHISFPNMSAEEMIWIMCKLALDTNMREKISHFKDWSFVTTWSKDSYLDKLKDAVLNDKYNDIIKICRTDKYSLVNVHSHNTLEWRGPRSFLDAPREQALKNVVEFYKLFWSFIKWMTDVLDENEINNISKDNFIQGIKTAMRAEGMNDINSFKMTSGKEKGIMSEETLNKLMKKTMDDIKFMATLYKTNKNFEQFVQYLYNKNRLGKRVEALNTADGIDQDVKNKINNICYKYVPYRMIANWFDTLSVETLQNTSKLTARRLFATTKLDGSNVTGTQILKRLDEKLEYFNTDKLFSKPYAEVIYNDENLYITDSPNVFKFLVSKDWLKDLNSNALSLSAQKLTRSEYEEQDKVMLKIILKTLADKGDTEALKSIANILLQNAVYKPSLVEFVNMNKKSIVWLITKIREKNSNPEEALQELYGILINRGQVSGPEWNKIVKFTKRDRNAVARDDLAYDEDDTEFRNRLNNAQLSGEEELI